MCVVNCLLQRQSGRWHAASCPLHGTHLLNAWSLLDLRLPTQFHHALHHKTYCLQQHAYAIKLLRLVRKHQIISEPRCQNSIEKQPALPSDIAFVMTAVHSKLAGPAEGLVTEMKTYLLDVWVKLVKNAFAEFPRLSARVLEEVSNAAAFTSTGRNCQASVLLCVCTIVLLIMFPCALHILTLP